MKTSYIRVRLSEQDKAEIKKMADANNMTVSEFVRFTLLALGRKVKIGA